MEVHALAVLPHYVDHLAPVWAALDPEVRGTFWAVGREAQARARALDVPARYATRRVPINVKRPPDWLWMVASFTDLRSVDPCAAVLMEHGSGQHYGGTTPSTARYYAGAESTDHARVVLFLAPNDDVRDRNRSTYPEAVHLTVGSPHVDQLAAARTRHRRRRDGVPVVAFAWHWDCKVLPESRSARLHWAGAVKALASDPAVHLLGHGHPRDWNTLERWWHTLGVETEGDLAEVIARADVFVADNTSALFAAAAVGVPVVVLDAPWYRPEVEHGLRFWRWADIGPRVGSGEPSELAAAIAAAPSPRFAEVRDAMTAEVYGQVDGTAASRAARAIEEVARGRR